MSQVTTGVRRILSNPASYDLLQRLMGGKRGRAHFVNHDLRPLPDDVVLDIGCGTAGILDYLPETIRYVGYDPSPDYIQAAKARFGSRGTFHCGLFDQAAAAACARSSLIIVSGVLHHLNDAEVRTLFTLLGMALDNAGRIVTIDPVRVARQNPIALALINADRGQNVRSAEQYLTLAKAQFPNATGIVRHRSWIPYTHWIMQCRSAG